MKPLPADFRRRHDAGWKTLSMIALTLTAPLIGFGLMLVMQWLEERIMTADARPSR